METPFGQLQGVAIKVVADTRRPGGGRRPTFEATRVVDFKLLAGGEELLVKGGDWQLELHSSHYEMNILRDDKRTDGTTPTHQVKSGGTQWDQRNMPPLTIKPHASDWWARYNGGRDDLRGTGAKGQTSRGAREFVLRTGELCAVMGMLTRTDSGARLCMGVGKGATGKGKGKGRAAITNKEAVSHSLKSCALVNRDFPPTVLIPMHQE